MSKCLYKTIANNLNKDELESYYQTHLPKDVADKFNFPQYMFRKIFDYLGIKRRTVSEKSKQAFYKDKNGNNKKNQYFVAEEVWTVRDPLKLKTAIENKLNYKVIY